MRPEDFEYLYNIEENYWWFVGMRQIIDTIIAGDLKGRTLTILDAGCGTGYNVCHYEKAGHSVFGLDLADEAIAGVQRRGLRTVCHASVKEIPYQSETFDLVLSFDVLDELTIDGAQEAICEIHRVLKPGGSACIRLPAFEWMRSSHDDDIETVHRYTRPELRGMLKLAGFDLIRATYANILLLPAAVIKRSLKKLGVGRGTDTKPLPPFLDWMDPIFRRILAMEAFVLAHQDLPAGLSVICYARKQR